MQPAKSALTTARSRPVTGSTTTQYNRVPLVSAGLSPLGVQAAGVTLGAGAGCLQYNLVSTRRLL